jgi:NAD(P)-dependent dehydrogenase (short-subunit alcohol dehydrogenase family)
VAVVTGAAGGIGRATALRLAADGARVVASDLKREGAEATAEAVRAAGGEALAHAADVAKAADCEALATAAAAWGGRLDIVVNNAGMGQFDGTVETLAEEEWDRVLAVNLKSVYLVSKYAVPHLRAAGKAAIVNVASPHAFATSEGVAAYAASKGGVVSLTRQMAIDLTPHGIRVVAVVPGAVDTPMLHAHLERQNIPLEAMGISKDPRALGRVGAPEELAAAIAFLASDDASFVNAAPIFVDGGLLAHL